MAVLLSVVVVTSSAQAVPSDTLRNKFVRAESTSSTPTNPKTPDRTKPKPVVQTDAVDPKKPADESSKPPAYPTCSSKPTEVIAMMQDILGVNLINKNGWMEDTPKFGGKSKIKVYGTNPMLVEMFNGKGESIGTTKVKVCAGKGKITAHIQMAGLNFGFWAGPLLESQLRASQGGNASELIMDISKTPTGQIRMADRMTKFKQRIDSTFSPVTVSR